MVLQIGVWLAVAALSPVVESVPEQTRPDAALIERVVSALRVRADAERAQALASLDDHRLIDVLVYVTLHDNDDDVSMRALELVASQGGVADPSLGVIARFSSSGSVVSAAIARLTSAARVSAAAALYELAADDEVAAGTRRQARDALRAAYASYLESRPALRVLGSPILPMLGGAFFGGYTLSTIGRFARTDVGTVIGTLGGGLIGGASGFVFGRNVSTERSFLHVSGLGWGLYSGLMLADATMKNPSDDVRLSLGVAGEATGWALTLAFADRLDFSASDVWITNFHGAALASIAAGALGFAPEVEDQRGGRGVLLGASLAGVGLGASLTKKMRFEPGDTLLTALSVVEGMWVGGFAPILFDSTRGDSGALIGGGVGFLVGEGLAQATALPPGDVAQMALVSGYGYALGGGVALLADGDDKATVGSMLATGLVGLGAAGRWGAPLDYASGDFMLIPVATALAAWHGAAIGGYFHDRGRMTEKEIGGLVLTSTGSVGLGAMVASQYLDATPAQVAMGGIGAVWGGWFGAWGAVLAAQSSDDRLLTTVLATDVGLVTSALLVSPAVGMQPRVIAGASLVGAGAAALAALGASFVTADSDSIIAANLVASGVGLLAGGWAMTRYFAPSPEGPSREARIGSSFELPYIVVTALPHVTEQGDVDGAFVQATLF